METLEARITREPETANDINNTTANNATNASDVTEEEDIPEGLAVRTSKLHKQS